MKIEKNKKIILVIVGIIILVGVFYCGMVYSKSKILDVGQFDQRGKTFGQNDRGSTGGVKNGGAFGGLTTGEIISKDAQSITLKLKDSGSKIIFYTEKTPVYKNVAGLLSELVVGNEVTINGKANIDGSINAETISIKPNSLTSSKQ